MVEVNKPDYLSLVNKNGSGFNVSELVTSIVASEIEPKRILQTSKLEKTESSISGIGFLNSQASTTQANFETISNDKFFEAVSTNSAAVELNIVDETKVVPNEQTISNVQTAKRMTFQVSGFSDPSDKFDANLQLQFGTWPQAGYDPAISNDPIDVFVPETGDAEEIVFSDKTLTQIAAMFSDIDGITARVIDLTGDGDSFTLVVESEDTGAANGFQITAGDEPPSGDSALFHTPNDGSSYNTNRQISQYASNARFELNGVFVERSTNLVDDIIDGVEINLKSDDWGQTSLSVTRSVENMKTAISDIVFSLNEFGAELDRLTFIDMDGDENGPLALDPAVARIKADFKKLSVEPIVGYSDIPIYMSQLGVKTNSSGEFYIDEAVFERAVRETPEKFYAIKDEFTGSANAGVDVFKSDFADIPAGSYVISQSADGEWKAGDIPLTKSDYNGGASFSSAQYRGVVVYSVDPNPSQFEIFIGQPFSERVNKLMTSILDLSSSLSKAEETYKQQTIDIEERLEKLKVREELISARYTQQFGAMEKAMTQFNSTKSLLDNFIEAWKKN